MSWLSTGTKRPLPKGYSRAQINLGYLYEAGLGVPQDLTTAMNWYRKASGLTEGDLEFVSSIEAAQRQAVKEEAVRLRQNVAQLQSQLREAKEILERSQAELQRAEQERELLLKQLEEEILLKQKQLEEQGRLLPAPSGDADAQKVGDTLDKETRAKLEAQLQETRQEQQRLIGLSAAATRDSQFAPSLGAAGPGGTWGKIRRWTRGSAAMLAG
ncbi:SEL1-like repeat protein [Nitrosococcus wardiae]|uniref:Sel1 repeat family protein n=1 Tax=Nitrosococcus wardiae TaxID=1814290 RepID=A0A4P7BVA4_9GAMM|nr:SEL1-like repeat protein [Nitrosococcus wardiae]QBQ53099.1 hypothetical protein E3U44_00210 [Nitrosococcus wardiae]